MTGLPFAREIRRSAIAAMVALSAAACADGARTFNPAAAPRRALVPIEAIDASGSTLIWDVGTSNQRVVPLSLGGRMFSVPADATPGSHTLTFDRPSGRLGPFTFTVKNETLEFGRPRIDRITTFSASFDPGGVQLGLYVQAANADVGAIVEVDGINVATVAHKAITNELYGVPQSSLGYPIHHYMALVATAGVKPPGSTLSVVVHNVDGSSDPFKYTVAASAQALDSDGDLLPDTWEQAKNDADPHRPDVFVELDVMESARPPTPSDAAGAGAIEAVQAMFAAAPFLNPFAANGINLVVDATGTVPFFEQVIFDVAAMSGNAANGEHTVLFTALKHDHFDHRGVTVGGAQPVGVYHYIVWAHSLLGGAGKSDAVLGDEFEPGDDIAIGSAGFTGARSDAEVLAHELGHNLGQRHGGWTDQALNPNYWSVMSYTWLFRTLKNVNVLRQRVTCLPFYYAKAGADEPGNRPPSTVGLVIDYSAGMARQISELQTLDESTGVCNQPVDWDADGYMTKVHPPGTVNANDDENDSKADIIDDVSNWRKIRFDGPAKKGKIP